MKKCWKVPPVLLVLILGCSLAAAAEEIQVLDAVEQVGPPALRPVLRPIHAVLMGLATLQLLVSMLIARRRSRDNSWLPKHKTLGVTSPLLLLAGAGVAYTMVASSGSGHLSVPHAWLGLTTVVLVLILPLLGFSIFRFPNRGGTLRALHAWIGRFALLLLLTGCVSGILM
jgi:hypothetical protein